MSKEPALNRSMLLAFALPAIMLGFTHAPESSVQGIYAKHTGLSLSALAGAYLISRIFDAITYPLIGHLSDLTYRRSGTRKPWIIAGTLAMVTGLWFLYRPPPDVTIVYYTAWFSVTYIGWKLTEIPYIAWSFNLSGDYVQRARIQLWRSMAMVLGGMVFFVVPYLAKALGLTTTTELNLDTLAITAIVIAVCVPLLNAYALATVPNGAALPPRKETVGLGDWRGMVRAVTQSRAMLQLMAAYVPVTFLAGMAAGVNYLFLDRYLGLAEQLPMIMLVATPCALLGLPFWGWLYLKFERHRVLAVSLVLSALAYGTIGFAPVGQDGFWLVIVMNALATFGLMGLPIAAPAMTGDVADEERLRTGDDRGGLYSGMLAFTAKSLAGVAGATGLFLLDVLGFDAKTAVQSSEGAFAIRLIGAWLPALGIAFGVSLIWNFPITRARQEATHAALKAREAAASLS